MSDNARVAIKLTLDGASMVSRGLGGITTGIGAVGHGLATATATAAHFLSIGKDVVNLAGRMASGVGKFTDSLIAPNIDFEDASVGFENLLGSADAAKQRIEALYAYANSTPFMNADVLDAGIKLENAGGAALGIGKGLAMVGDMAAYARKDLREVANWTARLYQNLQNGDPFMEAARRMMELNIITGAEVKSLNALSESGASGTAMWAAFETMMQKTNGSAKKMAGTMSGMKSTVAGLWTEMKRMTGEKLFEAMKEDLGGLSGDMANLFETGQIDKFAEKFGTLIKDLYQKLKTLAIGDLGLGDIMKAGLDGDIWTALKAGFGAVVYNFWQQMIHQARLYAPEIQAVLVPKRLQGMLGINKGLSESMDDRRERIGEAGYRDPAAAFRGGATAWSKAQGFDSTNAPVMSHSELMGGEKPEPRQPRAIPLGEAPQPRVIPMGEAPQPRVIPMGEAPQPRVIPMGEAPRPIAPVYRDPQADAASSRLLADMLAAGTGFAEASSAAERLRADLANPEVSRRHQQAISQGGSAVDAASIAGMVARDMAASGIIHAPQPRVIPTVAEFAGTAGANESAESLAAAGANTAGSMAAAEASAANVAKYMGDAAEAIRRLSELNNAASRLGSYTPARF